MDNNNSRRKFIKQALVVSAFSTGSLLSITSGIKKKTRIGTSSAQAMDNPFHAAPIAGGTVRIKYQGKSCFIVTASNGVKIVMDPIKSLNKEPADIATVSCGHYHHCDVYWVAGFPYIYKQTAPFTHEGVTLRGVSTRHLEMDEGRKIRADENYVVCIETDGMTICHLGALGSKLNREQVKQIGKVDILMVPVGGVSTLPVADAVEVCNLLQPKVVIPMHYKSKQSEEIPGATVDEFLKRIDRGGNIRGNWGGFGMKDFNARELPSQMQVMVL